MQASHACRPFKVSEMPRVPSSTASREQPHGLPWPGHTPVPEGSHVPAGSGPDLGKGPPQKGEIPRDGSVTVRGSGPSAGRGSRISNPHHAISSGGTQLGTLLMTKHRQ